MRLRVLALCLSILATGCSQKPRWPIKNLVASEPKQGKLPGDVPKHWKVKNYLLTPLATFDVTGLVLLTESFHSGREAELAPKDLTLGWRSMSNLGYLKQVHLSHSDRFYHWEIRGEVPDRQTVIENSANMHFIPANDSVAAILKSVRPHDLIRAQGYLVQVEAPDGWHWNSSTTRTDTGAGACELIYTQKLEVLLSPPD